MANLADFLQGRGPQQMEQMSADQPTAHTSPSGKVWRARHLPVSWTEHVDPKHMRLSPIEPDFQLELPLSKFLRRK
jgi:hypothetical protein